MHVHVLDMRKVEADWLLWLPPIRDNVMRNGDCCVVLGVRLRETEMLFAPIYQAEDVDWSAVARAERYKNNKIDFSFAVINNWKDTEKVIVCKTL